MTVMDVVVVLVLMGMSIGQVVFALLVSPVLGILLALLFSKHN